MGGAGATEPLTEHVGGQPLPSWPCTPPALAPASEPLRFGHPRFFTARSKATEIPVDPSSSRFVRGARLKRPALAQHCLHLASSTYINHVRVFGYNIPILFGPDQTDGAISMTTTIQRKAREKRKILHRPSPNRKMNGARLPSPAGCITSAGCPSLMQHQPTDRASHVPRPPTSHRHVLLSVEALANLGPSPGWSCGCDGRRLLASLARN